MPIARLVHSDAAASTAPAALKLPGRVTSIETGYFHSMNLAHPINDPNSQSMSQTSSSYQLHSPQYAHFLPKYFPRYGTSTIVNSSSNCCRLSRHSRSASESASSSLGETEVLLPAELEGSESMSSSRLGSTVCEWWMEA